MTTEKKWADLSAEERREDRFTRWLSPPDIKFNSPEAEKGYKARVTRFIKVIIALLLGLVANAKMMISPSR